MNPDADGMKVDDELAAPVVELAEVLTVRTCRGPVRSGAAAIRLFGNPTSITPLPQNLIPER